MQGKNLKASSVFEILGPLEVNAKVFVYLLTGLKCEINFS